MVEKSEIEIDELRERFGDVVGDLVEAMTEDETIADYEERKEEHRRRVAEADPAALAIFAADKLTNVAMLREAYALIGEGVSDELAVSLDLKIYIWEADLEMLFDEAPELPLTDEFADEMVGLWGDRFRAVDVLSRLKRRRSGSTYQRAAKIASRGDAGDDRVAAVPKSTSVISMIAPVIARARKERPAIVKRLARKTSSCFCCRWKVIRW